jgi:hypothetical protein
MHKRLGLLLALAFLASTSISAQVTITDTHEGGKPVPKPAPFNMKSAQAQNVSRQTPLRNGDIIQMVKSGQQQATILAALHSRGGSFDLSPQGCSALRGANVSQTILNAMGGGSRSQCNSSMPSLGAVQNQHTSGMLLGNQKSTLLGNSSGAVATPSNPGGPVSLNPQPLPPRTGKAAGASSVGKVNPKSATGTPGSTGASPAPQQ